MPKLPNANDLFGVILVCEHRCVKSEDDPEARIRELEQPLADAARASEAGVTPLPSKWAPPPAYTAPPAYVPPPADGAPPPPGPAMPPPLPYGGLFPNPSRGMASRNRTLWIIVGVFVVGMFVLPLAIFLFTAHQVSRSGITTLFPTPTFSPASPTAPATMSPTTTAIAPAMPSPAVTTPAGETITVSGISASRTIACNGGSVSISGITNTVVITGHCGNVTVSGIQNQITVDTADTIQASGSGNHVTYHTGSPKIDNFGLDNTVQQG
jgi:hypothetical protein